MLLQKYEPQSLGEFIGNRQQIGEIAQWAKNWKKGAIIIHGPTGTGKTLAIKLVAKELGFEVVERHANDPAELIKESFLKAAKQRSIFAKGKIFLIDDLEQADATRHIIELIKTSNFPVVLIATNPYERKLSSLRSYCKLVKFQKLRSYEIENFLRRVCEAEKIEYDAKALAQLAKMCNGDMRAALMDLEILKPLTLEAVQSLGYREKEENIFETLKVIFKTKDIENVATAIANSENPDVALWLEENIANEYEDTEEIAQAYEWLSKADIFYSRIIRRQSWSLQKYTTALAAFGVALSKKKMYAKFVNYNFPRRFRAKNQESEELLELAPFLHVSKRKAVLYRDLLQALSK